MDTLSFDTADVAAAEAFLSSTFAKVRLSGVPADQPIGMSFQQTSIGQLNVQQLRYQVDFRYDIEPPEKMLLCVAYTGSADVCVPGVPGETARPGDVIAAGLDHDVSLHGQVRHGRFGQLALDRLCLDEVAATAPGTRQVPVRITHGKPLSPTANNHLRKLIAYIRDNVVGDPAAVRSPLIASTIRQYVAASMLAAFPNTALLDPTIEDRHDSTPILLRRAVAFIDDNAHRGIVLADIAAAVHVTPRALQYLFRKHRDCTPMQYLRRVRLANAHRDLTAANRMSTTVAAVARNWGFSNVGRFAIDYRQAYGRSPHITLNA